MKKSLKRILASAVAMLMFAPSVKAQVIELTQDDFIQADVPAKSIGYDSAEEAYFLAGGEYKITEDITLPNGGSIYIHDDEVVIDATGYTVKGHMYFWDSDVTVVGGTFEGIKDIATITFSNSNVIIKQGNFKSDYANSVHFFNSEYVEEIDSMEIIHDKTLMIENGNFISNNDAALFVEGGKLITIKGGNFTGKNSGLELNNHLKAVIEKGKFKATFDESNLENPFEFVGAIGIDFTIDKNKINALLSENSVWAEDVEINVINQELTHRALQIVHTQKEISVISKKEKEAKEAAKKAEEEKKRSFRKITKRRTNSFNR